MAEKQEALTIDAFFTQMGALTAALTRVADNQDRLIAGQEAAMAKLETKSTGSGRGKAAAKKAEEKAPEPEPKSFLPAIKTGDADALKAHIGGWTGATDDADEKKARVAFLKDMANHFGCEAKFGELAADDDRLKQTLFYVERKKVGLDVNFSHDYDFDGDPAQDGPVDDSDFG